jgi:NADPH-dependent 2,4-dienoyl-CoA reductase/sulfur reductase-like enzyme/nitrite reductase/ring-hydroxylating ferredoxin subunit
MSIEKVVAKTGDLKDGEMKEVEVEGLGVLLVRADGKFYAIGSECTHFGGPLEEGTLHGHRVRCPWHQACFDVVTGDMLEPPALDSLSRFKVRVEGDDVIVTIPEGDEGRRVSDMVKYNPDADDRTFVIIGTGAAGNAAAEALRQDGFEGRVVMVTREERLPYDRTGLSKGFMKSDDTEPEMLRTADFYREYDIEVLTNHEVVSIDKADKKIAFQDNSSLKYDKLLLAPGSIPRRLDVAGASLENISTLRNPDNAKFIKSMAKNGSRIVIIGASFIGMETAASLSERDQDFSITIVAPESTPFEKTLGEEIGQMYRELHEENGISFRLGAQVIRFTGNGKVEEVILDNGDKLPADFVLMGVGVHPATGFLKGMDLNPDGSFSVDKNFQIAEDIYAAGDIASFIDWRTGERIRIEHWRLAEQHGRIAAHNMAGKETEYRSIPFFWTNQLGVNLGYMGYVKEWDDVIIKGDLSERNFAAYYVKNNRILAATGAGSAVQKTAIAELMRTDQMPSPDELRQGSIDMEKLIKG